MDKLPRHIQLLNQAAALATGDGVKRDLNRAARLYKQLADAGSGEAAFNLATMYQFGEGVRQSWPRAINLYRDAELMHNGSASLSLAEFYLVGVPTIRKSRIAAFKQFVRAVLGRDIRSIEGMARVIAMKPRMSAKQVRGALLAVDKQIRAGK